MTNEMFKSLVHIKKATPITNLPNQEMKLSVTCAQHLTAACCDVVGFLHQNITVFCLPNLVA
jgi:hypothetical protein